MVNISTNRAKWLDLEASFVLNAQSGWSILLLLLECPAVAVSPFILLLCQHPI